MPELPEVEVVKLGLEPLIIDRVIVSCWFSRKALRLPLRKNLFKKWVLGQKILQLQIHI